MKLFFSAFIVLFVVCSGSAMVLEGVVIQVIDGDTLWVSLQKGEKVKIRMARIDAPESRQEYGKASTEYLIRRVKGKTVKVKWEKKDKYGRIIGIVFFNGDDINLEMVATGNAWHYSRYDKTLTYAAAEQAARTAKLGLWVAST